MYIIDSSEFINIAMTKNTAAMEYQSTAKNGSLLVLEEECPE
jgi:hypothetical protein